MRYFILKNKDGTFYRHRVDYKTADIRAAAQFVSIEDATNWARNLRLNEVFRYIGDQIECIQMIKLEVANDNIEL